MRVLYNKVIDEERGVDIDHIYTDGFVNTKGDRAGASDDVTQGQEDCVST